MGKKRKKRRKSKLNFERILEEVRIRILDKRVLIGLGLVVVIVACYTTLRIAANSRAQRQAQHWLTRAQADVNSAATFDDVYRWLTGNGFYVWVWNSNQERGWVVKQRQIMLEGQDTSYYAIMGSKAMAKKGLFSKGSWLDLWFRFELEGTFKDVEFIIRNKPTVGQD